MVHKLKWLSITSIACLTWSLLVLPSSAASSYNPSIAQLAQQGNKSALAQLKNAAAQENPYALYDLGLMYLHGTGVKRNPERAAKILARAAELSLNIQSNSSSNIASNLLPSDSEALNNSQAPSVKPLPANAPAYIKQLLKKAQQGDAEAQQTLGEIYFGGTDLPQDYSQAFYWFKQSADQGNSQAAFAISNMYQKGLGVPQDSGKAKTWRSVGQYNMQQEFDKATKDLEDALNMF